MTGAPETHYRAGLAAGELRYQWCGSCRRSVFYPRTLCPYCSAPELSWRVSSGRGVVYATTTVRSREGARNVALVDLEEGFRMMTRVATAPERIRIGLPVGLRIMPDGDDRPQAAFIPTGEEQR